MAELIRQAIDRLLTDKRDHGDLAAKAQAALAEIDQEAQARRDAIQAMLGTPAPGKQPAPKSGRGRKATQQ